MTPLLIDLTLRSAAVSICLLLAINFAFARPFGLAAGAALAFVISASAYTIVSWPVVEANATTWYHVGCLVGFAATGLFWLTVSAIVDDQFELKPVHGFWIVINWALVFPVVFFPGPWSGPAKWFHIIQNILFVADAIRRAIN